MGAVCEFRHEGFLFGGSQVKGPERDTRERTLDVMPMPPVHRHQRCYENVHNPSPPKSQGIHPQAEHVLESYPNARVSPHAHLGLLAEFGPGNAEPLRSDTRLFLRNDAFQADVIARKSPGGPGVTQAITYA